MRSSTISQLGLVLASSFFSAACGKSEPVLSVEERETQVLSQLRPPLTSVSEISHAIKEMGWVIKEVTEVANSKEIVVILADYHVIPVAKRHLHRVDLLAKLLPQFVVGLEGYQGALEDTVNRRAEQVFANIIGNKTTTRPPSFDVMQALKLKYQTRGLENAKEDAIFVNFNASNQILEALIKGAERPDSFPILSGMEDDSVFARLSRACNTLALAFPRSKVPLPQIDDLGEAAPISYGSGLETQGYFVTPDSLPNVKAYRSKLWDWYRSNCLYKRNQIAAENMTSFMHETGNSFGLIIFGIYHTDSSPLGEGESLQSYLAKNHKISSIVVGLEDVRQLKEP